MQPTLEDEPDVEGEPRKFGPEPDNEEKSYADDEEKSEPADEEKSQPADEEK